MEPEGISLYDRYRPIAEVARLKKRTFEDFAKR